MTDKSAKQDCLIIPGRLTPTEICFVNSLIDDHDGMAVCRTVDAKEGRMEFWVSPDMLEEFYHFAEAINQYAEITLELGKPGQESSEMNPSKDEKA